MMYCHTILLLFLFLAAVKASNDGLDYESLPLKTIFPGPWESNIRAPGNKSYIVPVKIFNFEGASSNAEAVLQDAEKSRSSWILGPGGLITFEFAENIAGKVCFDVKALKAEPYLALSYSESPFFAGRDSDATGDRQARDLPLLFSIKQKGLNCVAKGYNRGAFKYLTVFMPEDENPVEGRHGFWHDGHSAPQRVPEQNTGNQAEQQPLEETKNVASAVPGVAISAVWVNCTAFPSNPNGRAYTGYFDSSSSLLNRIWYAGAWTLQLSTINPKEGGSDIDYNRNFDHNTAPQGAWYSNYTIANGTTCTTDGAKRDRMVWPGDMTIAVPGIAVSTYDMLAVRNALDTIYDHQYHDGSMPYAGPPMGAGGEFSDTYHLHTLVGTYAYVLYSGDIEWLKKRWPAYTKAVEISIKKVDATNLLHVSSVFDWIRPGMTGHNIEASAILYQVLENSMDLSAWLNENMEDQTEFWRKTRLRLRNGIATLYCEDDGLYSDNLGRRGCQGSEKVLPQDGNSWALLSRVSTSTARAYNVSENLRSRWLKHGAPAVEFPNVISPFASSFELLGHIGADNPDAAVELMELMWGYMLDAPGMTNSTLIEGYRVDGYIHYPAYWSDARNSQAHGWSAGPTTVLMQGILGITLTSPLGKTWSIKPRLTKWLSHARGGFATKLGKFEVDMSLMRIPSTGQKVAVLKAMVPPGTSGILTWGGRKKFIMATAERGSKFQFFRYLDGDEADRKDMHVLEESHERDFVKDDLWIKPSIDQRPAGVVDWSVLHTTIGFGQKRLDVTGPLISHQYHGQDSIKARAESNDKKFDEGKFSKDRQTMEILWQAFDQTPPGNWPLPPPPGPNAVSQSLDQAAANFGLDTSIQVTENHMEEDVSLVKPDVKDPTGPLKSGCSLSAQDQDLFRDLLADYAELLATGPQRIRDQHEEAQEYIRKQKESENRRVLEQANKGWAERVKHAEEIARTGNGRKASPQSAEELCSPGDSEQWCKNQVVLEGGPKVWAEKVKTASERNTNTTRENLK